MSSFRKPILVLIGLALWLSAGVAFGQPSQLYNNHPAEAQTRNLPAGTVVDPGSSLLYLIDTGVNLREAVGANLDAYGSSLAVVNQGPTDNAGNFIAPNPFGAGGSRTIYNGTDPATATVDPDAFNRNFITITNTHPTQAVTVHFRYFNDECEDFLDFLVLLTCNDTLIFDPLNFNIPGTSFNTQTRFFGPAVGLFQPIPAFQFASGRFLIFATAAGTSYEPNNATGTQDDNAELRFPFEFSGFISDDNHCPNLRDDTYFGLAQGLNQRNLHVFNSSAVAFNYLIGSWTTAVPTEINGQAAFQAWGVNAWTRPAVDLTEQARGSLRGEVDGDGPPLLGDPAAGGNKFRILTGLEIVLAANDGADAGTALDEVQQNALYLRNDVHGGDTLFPTADINGDGDNDYDSWYGALGATSLFGAAPTDQTFNFVSIIDDYNGSRHALDTEIAGLVDRSYNLNGARTVYVLQIFDCDENIFDVEEDTPINISPPPFEAPTAVLKITVDCLRVWITDVPSDSTSVDDLSIADLGGIADGLVAFLTQTKNPLVDASQGWIRFVRDNSIDCSNNSGLCYGTWRDADLTADSNGNASFVTIAEHVVRFSGFGAAWWVPAVASDPRVSDTGDPQCDGLCPNGGELAPPAP